MLIPHGTRRPIPDRAFTSAAGLGKNLVRLPKFDLVTAQIIFE